MRLTADLLARCPARINPLREREVDVRGYKIPAIENLGCLQDQFDCVDLSDNEIKKLGNFPRMKRLKCLLLNHNHVGRVGDDLADALPSLEILVLTGNKVATLSQIDQLAALPRLQQLSLIDNPVCRRQHYRAYLIHKMPGLKVLDYHKIKPKERQDAARLFKSSAGKALADDVQAEAEGEAEAAAKTFVPGEVNGNGNGAGETVGGSGGGGALANLTAEQRAAIQAAIASAKTPEEVDRVEKQLKAGIIPGLRA